MLGEKDQTSGVYCRREDNVKKIIVVIRFFCMNMFIDAKCYPFKLEYENMVFVYGFPTVRDRTSQLGLFFSCSSSTYSRCTNSTY